MDKSLHPFERAKLGKAPFRCIGVRENWYSPTPDVRQPGGSCDYCGTGILYEYIIAHAGSASTFVVGCDCVRRTGGEELVPGAREERLKLARGKREAGAAVRRQKWAESYQAGKARRVDENRADWIANHAALDKRLRDLAADSANEFLRAMVANVDEWGGLTENMRAAVERVLDREEKMAYQRANSKHLGAIGKRMKLDARVTFCKKLSDGGYQNGYYQGPKFLVKLESVDGDALVWFGGCAWHVSPELVAVKFTPKAHEEYRGVPQTVISRLAEA